MRNRSHEYAVIPLALLALVALVGGLVLHARSLEGRHRATAEAALRDYAALAAWQYTQRVETFVAEQAHITLHVLHPHFRRFDSAVRLPRPDTIVTFGDSNACGIGRVARFSFRVDLPSGHAVFAGAAPDAAARGVLAARFAAIAARDSATPETTRMLVDTVAGAVRLIAYGIVRGADSLPRAIYGVEAEPGMLIAELKDIPNGKPLLPPALVRGKPIDSLITITVRRSDGGALAKIGGEAPSELWAEDRTSPRAGGLVTRVAVRPQAASLLLIGGMPGSRLGTLSLLLAGSVVLAAIALLQLRRGRELARLRTRFVASVSHELRTPLAQISMFGETLLLGRERSREEGQEFLSIIVRETRRLTNLVESVLRFSRTDADATPRKLQVEARDVAQEIADAVRSFGVLADAAGVRVETRLGDDAFAMIEPNALRQIVLNLLDNALKFGPEGQRIAVRVAREVGGREIVVSVSDQGPGIPRDERSLVFKPFAQGSQTHSRTATGAGIGLAVVSELVTAHGGRVWIDDGAEGRGTIVSFALPAIPSVQRVEPVAAAEMVEAFATR